MIDNDNSIIVTTRLTEIPVDLYTQKLIVNKLLSLRNVKIEIKIKTKFYC